MEQLNHFNIMKAKLSLTLNGNTVEWTGPEEEFNDQDVTELFSIFKGLLVTHTYSEVSLMHVVEEWIKENPEIKQEVDKLFNSH